MEKQEKSGTVTTENMDWVDHKLHGMTIERLVKIGNKAAWSRSNVNDRVTISIGSVLSALGCVTVSQDDVVKEYGQLIAELLMDAVMRGVGVTNVIDRVIFNLGKEIERDEG